MTTAVVAWAAWVVWISEIGQPIEDKRRPATAAASGRIRNETPRSDAGLFRGQLHGMRSGPAIGPGAVNPERDGVLRPVHASLRFRRLRLAPIVGDCANAAWRRRFAGGEADIKVLAEIVGTDR
jgi:hypothetical protein